MKIVSDLHLHSKYSRAVSQDMVLSEMEKWAKKKGIDIMATGDWTHPLWVREIQEQLIESNDGIYKLKSGVNSGGHMGPPLRDVLFLLSTEISSIYQQGGKLRRVHNLVFAPSFETVSKINAELIKRGCSLASDGRPIIGLSCRELAELIFSVDENCLIVPAHCLISGSYLMAKNFIPKKIDDFLEGEEVLTHTGVYHKVEKVLKRRYEGEVIRVRPWYFREGLTVTPEHPFLAIKTLKKCPSTGDICRPSKSHLKLCKRKTCLEYKKEWVLASNLEIGDMLVYPRCRGKSKKKIIEINESLSLGVVKNGGFIYLGVKKNKIPEKINISKDLALLLGYYLAEGYATRDNIAFCFNSSEEVYIEDVKRLVSSIFGINYCREYRRKNGNGIEVIFFSKILCEWFGGQCYLEGKPKKAPYKKVPEFLLSADGSVQAELIRGWYRGDKGYTSSRALMDQMKMLFVRNGVIPSIFTSPVINYNRRKGHYIGKRKIEAGYDYYSFSNLAFFEDDYDLKKEIPRSDTKINRRHGWIDKEHVYLPIKELEKSKYKGNVYNLEVEHDHSYVSEFATVHNCWTPWFALYGSMSGFDSIDEAFGSFSKNIYAVETGLSSDPAMNWRIKELDDRAILSFSDAHSGAKLGREATIFAIAKTSFSDIRNAIISGSIDSTIEFYPEEGKYHYSGHRKCKIRQKNGGTCPVCGKPLTAGVMQRVEKLAGRGEEEAIKFGSLKNPPFKKLVGLNKIIAESLGVGEASNKVIDVYDNLIRAFGNELFVLMEAGISEIAKISGEKISEGVDKVRNGDIVIDPGYDGEYGVVKIWGEKSEETLTSGQMSLLVAESE